MVAAQTSYIGGDRQMQMRLKKAAEIVEERHKDSVLLDREAEDRIPRFDFEGECLEMYHVSVSNFSHI